MKIVSMSRLTAATLLATAFAAGWNSHTQRNAVLAQDETLELLSTVSVVELPDGAGGTLKTVLIDGVNVQVVNGLGASNGLPANPSETDPNAIVTDGAGNLIVGYTESPAAAHDRRGSHHLVVGARNAWTQFGGIVAGDGNAVDAALASTIGGKDSVASEVLAVAIGGRRATASGEFAVAIGGANSLASGALSSVLGGGDDASMNEGSAELSTSVGGRLNDAAARGSLVLGANLASTQADDAVVVGGALGSAAGSSSVLLGGSKRSVQGDHEVLGDGQIVDDGDWSISPSSISADALVGVGAAAPEVALQVASSSDAPMAVRGDLALGEGTALELRSESQTWRVEADAFGSGELAVQSEGVAALTVDAEGDVGLSAPQPVGALHVYRRDPADPSDRPVGAPQLTLEGGWLKDGGAGVLFRQSDRENDARLGFFQANQDLVLEAQARSGLLLDRAQDRVVARPALVTSEAATTSHMTANGNASFQNLRVGTAQGGDANIHGTGVRVLAWGVMDSSRSKVAGSDNWERGWDGTRIDLTDLTEFPENAVMIVTVAGNVSTEVEIYPGAESPVGGFPPNSYVIDFTEMPLPPFQLAQIFSAFSFVLLQYGD